MSLLIQNKFLKSYFFIVNHGEHFLFSLTMFTVFYICSHTFLNNKIAQSQN